MNSERQKVEAIFEAALALESEAQRQAYLATACADVALRQEVESLLEAHRNPDKLFAHEDSNPGRRPGSAELQEAQGTVIGRYKLLERIGEGGCGVVYVAEQEEPVKRRVAVKIIKPGMDSKSVVARFQAEQQALAMMDHPNIAKFLDAGTVGAPDSQLSTPNAQLLLGRPYFVMELVRGIKITDYCDQNNLSTSQRLALFMQVCQAVQHAHQKGIIHRDLKPSNILVTVNDGVAVPKIIDFGIAKATEGRLSDQTVYTQLHQFIGTPAYMSPEQAQLSSLDVDTRSDIYGLGVLLYELLTGRTPFDAPELLKVGLDALRQVIREAQPPRPSTRLSGLTKEELTTAAKRRGADPPRLISLLRGDLDWIVMKCLEKDRVRRYDTASGLARDIERHLNHEPVGARPPSRVYEFQKSVRRHWVGFAAVAAVVAALAIGMVVSALEALRARRAEKEQITQYQRAEEGERRGERLSYAGKMNMAQVAWEQNRVAQVRQLLADTAAYPDRGFEWYYWQRQAHLELKTLRGHLEDVGAVAFSPDGRRIVTGSLDTTAKVWDVASGNELFSLKGHRHAVNCVAYSLDGQRIVTGSFDTTAKIWDAASGEELKSLEGHGAQVVTAFFSRDGQKVVTASWDGTAKVWDAANGNLLLTLRGHTGQVNSAAFSPDGERIVTGDDQMARVWDARKGVELFGFKAHRGAVWCADFSPDGQWIVTGGDAEDPTARVWEVATHNELVVLAGHESKVSTALFSPDGQRIATASDDRTARVWEATTGKELFTIKGHGESVVDVAFSPDGRWIVTGSRDDTAKVWDATGNRDVLTLKGHTLGILAVGFSPDGKRIVTGGGDESALVWDARSGRVLFPLPARGGLIRCVAFSPNGRWIATGDDQSCKIWEAASGEFLFALAYRGIVTRLAFSPDGQRILTGGPDGIARLWETATGKPLRTFQGHTEGISGLAFSPDGQRIVTASADRSAKVWDVATTNILCTLQGHSGTIGSVAFSPDGQRILTGSRDKTARVWDSRTGIELFPLRGHSDAIQSVAFSPDGRRLLTGSWDNTAKVWDAVAGVELLTLKGHRHWVHSVAFSPDGQRIVTASDDATAKVWETATPDQLAAWQEEEKNAQDREVALARQEAAADQQARALTVKDPGAISHWLVLGPLTFMDYDAARLAEEQIVDEAHLRPSAEQPTQAGGTELRWRAVPLDDYRVGFERIFRSKAPWCVAYLVAYIQSDSDQTNLSLRIGGEELKVYLNGREIYKYDKPRKYVADQDVVSGLELKAGVNVLVVKVVYEGWVVDRASVRFTDATGQPVKGIRVTLTPTRAR